MEISPQIRTSKEMKKRKQTIEEESKQASSQEQSESESLDDDDDDDDDEAVDFGFEQTEKPKGRRLKKEKLESKRRKSGGFESMDLPQEIYKAIKRKGFRQPTPIQRKAIPIAMTNCDLVAMARTGSGKTCAFVVPVLSQLGKHSLRNGARALILAPTRELALQTFTVVRELGKFTDLRFCALVGGDSMEMQFEDLANNPDVLVATPGRVMHHVNEIETFSLRLV